MSNTEFTPESVRVLTNITDSSLALEIIPGQVTYLQPNEQILYSDFVDIGQHSEFYNLDRIDQFINDKVLSDSIEIIETPTTVLNSITVQSFVAELRSETNIRVSTKTYTQIQNHLEIIPIKNTEDELLCIYYRDVDGMSYSLDGGTSCISISNENLKYPSEITSASVQIYESPINSIPVLTLYIGTLREGIKKFTPGKDTTYVDFVSFDSINVLTESSLPTDPIHPDTGLPILPTYRTDFLFKHYVQNLILSADTVGGIEYNKYDGKLNYTYSHKALEFAPVFIIGILNYEENNGCPLIAYTRTTKDSEPIYRYLVKNLHSVRYNLNIEDNRIQKDLISSDITSNPNVKSASNWVILQEMSTIKHNIGLGLLPFDVLDIRKSCEDYNLKYCVLKCPYTDTKFENKILALSSNTSKYGGEPSITSQILPTLPEELLYNNKLKSISTFFDTIHSLRYIFITEDKSVWSFIDSWEKFIHKDISYDSVSTKYFTTGISNTLSLCDNLSQKAHDLSGFCGFSIARLSNTLNFVFGFLSTSIGVIRYYLEVKPSKLDIKVSSNIAPRLVCQELPQCQLADFTTTFGTGLLLGCNYANPLRAIYYNNELLYQVSSVTASTTQIEIAKRNNYLVKNEPEARFVSGNMIEGVTYIPSDQVIELFIPRAPNLDLALKSYIKNCTTTQTGIPLFCRAKTNYDHADLPNIIPLFDRDLHLYLCQSFGKYINLSIDVDSVWSKTVSSFTYTLTGSTNFFIPCSARISEPPSDIYVYNSDDFID